MNSGTAHMIDAFDGCYLTDGNYSGGTNFGDQGVGINLLQWSGSECWAANCECNLTIYD